MHSVHKVIADAGCRGLCNVQYYRVELQLSVDAYTVTLNIAFYFCVAACVNLKTICANHQVFPTCSMALLKKKIKTTLCKMRNCYKMLTTTYTENEKNWLPFIYNARNYHHFKILYKNQYNYPALQNTRNHQYWKMQGIATSGKEKKNLIFDITFGNASAFHSYLVIIKLDYLGFMPA